MVWKFNAYCSMIKKSSHFVFGTKEKTQYEIIHNNLEKLHILWIFEQNISFFFHNIVTFMLCAAKENFWFIQHTARFIMYNFHIILFFSGKQKFTYCLVYVLLLHDNSEIKHSTNSIVPILSLYGLAKKNPTYSKFVDMPSSTQ